MMNHSSKSRAFFVLPQLSFYKVLSIVPRQLVVYSFEESFNESLKQSFEDQLLPRNTNCECQIDICIDGIFH